MQVRNAANVVVQPEYGDDGMDPVAMEGKKGEPVALQQKLCNSIYHSLPHLNPSFILLLFKQSLKVLIPILST